MGPISELREVLLNVLLPENTSYDEQELFDELMVQKPRLLALLDVGSRNSKEQKEVESGKMTIEDKQVAINTEFASQVLFLSQQLECSERYIAALLDEILKENPGVDSVTSLELTVELFHLRRRHLVDTLRYLVDATKAADSNKDNKIHVRLARYFVTELIPASSGQDGNFTLVTRIWKQIEQLNALVARTDSAKRGAASNTVAPTGHGTPSLGFDILNSRYDSLKYERRSLAVILTSISHLGYLSPSEVKLIVEWLAKNPSHPLTYYFLTAILLAFDPVDPSSSSGRLRQDLVSDKTIVTFMNQILGPSTAWKEQGLKAAILLKWTLFLTEARHADRSLENREGFEAEKLETQVWNGVQGDAFMYLFASVQQLVTKRSVNSTQMATENQEQREAPSDDFCDIVLQVYEMLLRSLITHASSELRKIKQKQEDIAHTRDRARNATARFSGSAPPESEKSEPPTRNDIAALYALIGVLYSALPPERGLQFWGATPGDHSKLSYMEYLEMTTGRLPAFLQWAIWSTSIQDLPLLTALYDMLGGLAKGQQCSEFAYNFMARGSAEVLTGGSLRLSATNGPSISWIAIFNLLDSWAQGAANVQGALQPQILGSFSGVFNSPPSKTTFSIGPDDVLCAQSFLRLLSTTVRYSVAVRMTISSHTQFRAIPTLVTLITVGIPLELKGSIFDALAAFCEPGAGIPGVEICKAVWTLMERLEVINVRASAPSGFNVLATSKGVELELEQIETIHKMYPATIPFLRLLGTLIHTQKRIPPEERLLDFELVSTMPENLGHPYRLPGIGPFSAFVIDNVFANIPNREYTRPSDRWEINDLCLAFIERALASYDLEHLVGVTEETSFKAEKLLPLVSHPGYDIMVRLLTYTPLQNSILSYIIEGVEGFDRNLAEEEPFFRNTIVRVMRIVHRVLEIQDLFLDILVPLLSDLDNATFTSVIHPRSYYTPFDQCLSFGALCIPSIAIYISYPSHSELSLLSIKILSLLCSSTNSLTIIALIERSRDSERILGGFMRIIGIESLDDVWEAEAFAEEVTGAGSLDPDEKPGQLAQANRLCALELLIRGTEQDRPYPNIAHYFLLGGTVKEQRIEDPSTYHTSFPALLRLLDTSIPKLKDTNREGSRSATPLVSSLPGLAERCCRVIWNLCVHPRTSEFTTRYLRMRENFFARQLASVPLVAPSAIRVPFIQVRYEDGDTVATTVPLLSASLRLRSHICHLAALELQLLVSKGQFKGVTELLDILFGTDVECEEDEFGFPSFRRIGQSQMRIIDFLQSLMFDWADSLQVQPQTLQYLSALDLEASIRRDASGCEVVDRAIVLTLISDATKMLHAQGAISTVAQSEQLKRETTYILESCAVENHRRKVLNALIEGFQAWKQLLDICLMKCFDRLPHDRRENMLFDLLYVLPTAERSSNISESVSVLLAETILSLVTKLREDRQHQIILQSIGGNPESGSLPTERLYTILHNILQGILDSNRVELVRGNLYAALINFIHLIASPNETSDFSSSAMSISLFGSLNQSQSLIPASSIQNKSTNTSALLSGTLNVMRDVIEPLVTIIARDAIDGTEVWKTIAFTLLDALVQLSGQEKQSVVVTALSKDGILSNFVEDLKESDERLQSIIKPEPDDLNLLYVYEAKFSLFNQMSRTRSSAEKLLGFGIIPFLAKCDYLDARPESDQSFMDQGSFLPSAVQRYHQLFMPALQVIGGILTTLGNKHATATKQVLEFLASHGSTIVILLKNDTDHTSFEILDEIYLIIKLCTSIFPSVPKSEVLVPNSGFGALHVAILTLATRSLSRDRCFNAVIPQSETEVQNTRLPTFGNSTESLFDATLAGKERLIRKAITSYVGVSSDFTEPEITLVISPSTNTTHLDDRGSRFTATVPTIGDTMQAIDFVSDDIVATLRQISDFRAELVNKDHIVTENVKEVLRHISVSLLNELDTEQKRSLICQEIGKMIQQSKSTVKTLCDTLEMLLLLLWRHLEYYADPKNVNDRPLRTTSVMRLPVTSNQAQFHEEVKKRLDPLLQRISSLEFDEGSLGRDWQSRQAYIEIITRRLKDSIGGT